MRRGVDQQVVDRMPAPGGGDAVAQKLHWMCRPRLHGRASPSLLPVRLRASLAGHNARVAVNHEERVGRGGWHRAGRGARCAVRVLECHGRPAAADERAPRRQRPTAQGRGPAAQAAGPPTLLPWDTTTSSLLLMETTTSRPKRPSPAAPNGQAWVGPARSLGLSCSPARIFLARASARSLVSPAPSLARAKTLFAGPSERARARKVRGRANGSPVCCVWARGRGRRIPHFTRRRTARCGSFPPGSFPPWCTQGRDCKVFSTLFVGTNSSCRRKRLCGSHLLAVD